ncbi:hypothetical protein AAEX28_15095 [Lentisphaerota bacterium WC36G]|nr:hypothetical protein LJT99_01850 [Lentisphaerae bacterium WC36]
MRFDKLFEELFGTEYNVISDRVKFKIDKAHLKIIKGPEKQLKVDLEYEFNTSINISDKIALNDNKLCLTYTKRNGLSLEVDTTLTILGDNKNDKKAFQGSLNASKNGLIFAAESKNNLNNVTEIEGLNVNNLYLNFNIQKKEGFSVGLIGEMEFKRFKGFLALHLNPGNPKDTLVAINFNGLSMNSIISSILDIKNTGVDNILEEIAIKPVTILSNIDNIDLSKESISNNIISKISSTKSTINTDKFYIKYVKDDKENFVTYCLRNSELHHDKLKLEKFTHMYICTNPKGIDINGNKFPCGVKFAGKLHFLGVTSIAPKKGFFLHNLIYTV